MMKLVSVLDETEWLVCDLLLDETERFALGTQSFQHKTSFFVLPIPNEGQFNPIKLFKKIKKNIFNIIYLYIKHSKDKRFVFLLEINILSKY